MGFPLDIEYWILIISYLLVVAYLKCLQISFLPVLFPCYSG
jgi:hypothetical protein